MLVESRPDQQHERALWFHSPRAADRLPLGRRRARAAAARRERAGARPLLGRFLAYEAGYGLQPLGCSRSTIARAWRTRCGWGCSAASRSCAALPSTSCSAHGPRARPGWRRRRPSTWIAPAMQRTSRASKTRCTPETATGSLRHSLRARFRVDGSPWALFQTLRQRQRTAYSAVIDTGEYAMLSLSPELFFRKRGAHLELKPMKAERRATGRRNGAGRVWHIAAMSMRQDPEARGRRTS